MTTKTQKRWVYGLAGACVFSVLGLWVVGLKTPEQIEKEHQAVLQRQAQKRHQEISSRYQAEVDKLKGLGVASDDALLRAAIIVAPEYHLTPGELANYLASGVSQ